MENSSIVALSRQSGLRRQLDVIAHNLANMNTTGYKQEKMMFTEHLVRSKESTGIMGEKLAYTRDIATFRDFSEGPIEITSNPLDLAVRGEGYFAVQTDEGERYTRHGRFELNSQGQLVTMEGDAVLSDAGQPFFFGPTDTDITVARDGTVSTPNGPVGRLRLVQFENPHQLNALPGNLFESTAQPQDAEKRDVVQYALEGSNVNPIGEITQMIKVQRAYDSVRNFIDKEDKRQKSLIEEMGRVA